MTIKFRPFTTPNYAIADLPSGERITGQSSYHLKKLDASDLDQLCTEFRRAVFHKANKKDPRTTTNV